jgi:hypothetical protein
MDIKRKQHILPESYLKHWLDPATKVAGKTPMVWKFTKDKKQKEPKPPAAGHFWRDYFYDLISTSGERRQNLENLLGKIEGSMARIVEQRIFQKHSLNQIESEELDLFVACMFMRTERMKNTVTSAVYYQHVVLNHNIVQTVARTWTNLKKSLRRGKASAEVDDLPALVLPAPPPAVGPGVERRFRALVRQVKISPNYTPTIGHEVGIEASDPAAPDSITIQPRLTATINGNQVELGWDWQGYRAFLDLCELQVNRNDGRGFVPLTHSVKTGCRDTTPFPAAPVPWQYRAIYHADGKQVGAWSQIVSVTVGA